MPLELEALQSKNRNFICSCQKAYLSYAALFTHIKQKHGGKAPGDIVRPRSLNKRGRPRKNEKPGSDKEPRSESSDGFLGNNNLKNINFANESNFNQNQSRLNNPLTKGFTSYKDSKRFPDHISTLRKYEHSPIQFRSSNELQIEALKQEDDENMEFANPNNELSSNTLALASIIIGLQQFFKDVNSLEVVRDDQLETFSSYIDLKQFHSQKLRQKADQKGQQDVFLLGNIICAFLNFCHQTLQGRIAYQQVVLLIVCLLEHIKKRKSRNVLISCRKEVIHECLPSFFQQYLEKVIIKSKLNFWIFKDNNSFKVLIWFLNWLSAIEANYLKNNSIQKAIFEEAEEDAEDEEQPSEDEDEEAVEFEHPNFLKEIVKGEKISNENKTFSSIKKRSLENRSMKKDASQISQSINSSENEEKNEEDAIQLKGNVENSQDYESMSENDKNDLIGMERLSSEVR